MKLLLDSQFMVLTTDPQVVQGGWRDETAFYSTELGLTVVTVSSRKAPAGVARRYRYIEGVFEPITLASDAAPMSDVLPVEVPASVTMRQARLALLHAGLLDDVEAALAAIPDETARRAAQIEWEYAQDVERDSPWVQQLATALGLDAAMLDELFITARQQ